MKLIASGMGRIVILILSVLNHLNAQQPGFQWASSYGSYFYNVSYDVATDSFGNVYTIGGFSGSADFDPGPGTHYLTATHHIEVFVTKLDALGHLVWAFNLPVKTALGHKEDFERKIVLDGNGHFYISGIFWDLADFDPGPDTHILSSELNDFFVAKFTTDGSFVWARQTFTQDQFNALKVPREMVVDYSGAVYLYGDFWGILDFDPGPGVHVLSATERRACIWKLDSNGAFEWADTLGGEVEAYDMAIISHPETSAQSLLLYGYFSGLLSYDLGSGLQYLSDDSGSVFLVNLSLSGQVILAKNFAVSESLGMGYSRWYSVSADRSGHIFLTGLYSGTPDVDPGLNVYFLPNAPYTPYRSNMFVSKLTYDANLIWAKAFQGDSSFYYYGSKSRESVTDNHGNVYITGCFGGQVDFNPGNATAFLQAKYQDAFILKLNPNGDYIWAVSMTDTSDVLTPDLNRGLEVSTDQYDNVYTVGEFESSSVDFDPGPDSFLLFAPGISGGFTQKLSQCPTAFDTLYVTACQHYSLGGRTFDSNGWYAVVLPNAAQNCDSIIALNLIVQPIDPTVLQSGDTLIAQSPNAIYQWLDCNNGSVPIPGATSASYVPDSSGKYAVVIQYADCVDTSACVTYDATGIYAVETETLLRIYPNPSNGILHVDLNLSDAGNYLLSVTDLPGQRKLERHIGESGKQTLDVSALSVGVYFIQLKKDGRLIASEKFVRR